MIGWIHGSPWANKTLAKSTSWYNWVKLLALSLYQQGFARVMFKVFLAGNTSWLISVKLLAPVCMCRADSKNVAQVLDLWTFQTVKA
jgi:hypothetical protein